ncbi:glycosyltransferase [Puia sp. P3]|uniref:glycosyltransferase family 2 protein n=1 Tax=Puia sp. P3 TaxID=3423952 RepID=UPI003D6753AD
MLRQDYRNFEVLIMDGGSDDTTATIAHESGDNRIRFISEPDKGIYDAMNKGIAAARGEWLFFLGSDDQLYDTKTLSSIFGKTGHDDADMLYGDVVSPSYKGRYDGQFDYPKLLLRNISHQAIFYRRSLFDAFGAYNLRYKGYADWDLNIRLFAANDSPDGPRVRIKYIDAIVARFGPGGVSSSHDSSFLREVLFPCKLKWLEEKGIGQLRPLMVYDDLWRLLRNAGFPDALSLTGPPAQTTTAEAVLPVVRQMAAWQERIPRGALKIGPLSKLIMLASYLRHLLNGKLH